MLQLDSNRVCKSTTLNTLKKEVFISQNTNVPVITDQDVSHTIFSITNLTNQNCLDDSSQLFAEFLGRPLVRCLRNLC
jgi:hypothetical protein